MQVVANLHEWQRIRKQLSPATIGFVPTMGHLHEGHMSLCKRSQQENEKTVVSIYVNPFQFNQIQDYELYPRTLEQDKHLLAKQNVDYLLLPAEKICIQIIIKYES